jgi:hypothetical protein
MASSYVTYPADGVQTNWSFSFPYLNKAHVKAYTDGGATVVSYTWVNSSTIAVSPALASGKVLLIRRETPDGPLVDFQNTNNLTEEDLDLAVRQSLYRAVEAKDRADLSIVPNTDGNFDLGGHRLVNVADPVSAQDAVTKVWAETTSTSQVAQAITAKDAAVVAKVAAEAAEANAETAAAAAAVDAAATAADRIAVASDKTAAHTDKLAADADAAATAADRTAVASDKTAAAGSATAAAGSATAAAGSATAASGSATAAAGSATAASNSSTLAQQWADNAENVPVLTLPDRFSAKHWAAKAAASVASAASTATSLNVKDYGAVGNGTTDDTIAIQNALTAALSAGLGTFIPKGTFLVTNALNVGNQRIHGAGLFLSKIIAKSASFNLSATGIIVATSTDPGPTIEDFWIDVEQPDTAVRANLIAYPPSINVNARARSTIRNMMITKNRVAISATGNAGGLIVDNVGISSFVVGVDIEGALDTVRINNLHHWVWNLTANQMTIFQENNASGSWGVRAGRCDSLMISNSLFFSGLGIKMFTGVSGAGVLGGSINNCAFDNLAGIQSDGHVSVSVTGCYFTPTGTSVAIANNGGPMLVTGCYFGGPSTNDYIQNLLSSGVTKVSNCFFDSAAIDKRSVLCNTGRASVIGCDFKRTANVTYTSPAILQAAGRLTAIGNFVNDKGTGTGNFIACLTNEFNNCGHNTGPGWSYGGAGWATSNGRYTDNN